MTTATITPKYVNQPMPGKKLGSIKDQQDVKWFIDPGLLGSFRQGTAITIEWAPMKFQDGSEAKKITGVVHGAAPAQSNGAAPISGNNNTGREIFITGVVGRAMGSGKFSITDMHLLAVEAMAVWEAIINGTRKPPARPDEGLNDPVQF